MVGNVRFGCAPFRSRPAAAIKAVCGTAQSRSNRAAHEDLGAGRYGYFFGVAVGDGLGVGVGDGFGVGVGEGLGVGVGDGEGLGLGLG